MDKPPHTAAMLPRRLLAALVVLAVLVGAGYALLPRAAGVRRPPATADTAGVVERALALAADTTKRHAWVDAVPGIDDAGLSPGARAAFIRLANAERCTCGCGFTLAACRVYDPSCEVSLPLVRALLDSVAAADHDARGGS